MLYKVAKVEIQKLHQANVEILVSYSRNPRLGMTPLPQPKAAGIRAGRRATTTSSKEEARVGDWALKVFQSHMQAEPQALQGS